MSRGDSFTETAKAHGHELLKDVRGLSRSPWPATAVGKLKAAVSSVALSVATGLVTDSVASQWDWRLPVPMLTLAAAVVLLTPYRDTQVPAVVPAGPSPASSGVPAGTGGSLGRLVSTVMASAYREFSTESAEPGLADERDRLEGFLKADQPNVILVYGPPGAGKTTLVTAVLRKKRAWESRARLHDLAFLDRFDAKALLDDIESGRRARAWLKRGRAGAALKPGEDLLGRLELAVETRGAPVIIVIDGAQCLFGPDNNMDEQVAEALEIIARGRRRVKVVLVVQERPEFGSGAWHGTEDRIFVGGLNRKDFDDLLRRLNPAFRFGPTDRTTTDLDKLYDVLHGNPRQAEMFCAALGLPDSRLSADGLARRLAQKQPEERKALLASAVVDSLSPEQQQVVAALAAYGIPVTIEHVNELVAKHLPASQVGVLVPELVNWRVIGCMAGKASGRYYLPAPEIYDALVRSENLNADLMLDAVEKLWPYLVPEEKIRGLDDLRWHFAALDILLRAAPLDTEYGDPWGPLWGQLNGFQPVIERKTRRWSAEGLLLKYREALNMSRGYPDREMVNSNALGCIYMARGRLDDARQAFGDAWQRAIQAGSSSHRRKILINLAAVSWNSGHTLNAMRYYCEALEEYNTRDPATAADKDDEQDLVTMETGLADCYRRWGRFGDAIYHGEKAHDTARNPASLVGIAVRLARWWSELNQQQEAGRLMREAERIAKRNPALLMYSLAGRADLSLAAGQFRRARRFAKKALNKALKSRDTATVLQASTTLAMTHLELGHVAAAQRDIDRASRCRREGRSLDVLALRALIAFRSAPDGEKAREYFVELKTEAAQRQRDKNDFAAWDFEGLAICGEFACGKETSLGPAVDAFREARKHASAPGLDAQLERWLKILAKSAPGLKDWKDPVMAAINRTAADG